MIQIDIPIPENCAECPCYGLNEFEHSRCNVTGHEFPHNIFDGRAEDCPLKEQDSVEHALEVLRKAGWTETQDVPFPAELLKEQEAVEPIPPKDESDLWRCGNCNHQLFRCTHQRYCEMCGRSVKWE